MVEENLRREKVAEKYTDLGGSSSSPPITVLDDLCKSSHLTQPHFYDFLIICVNKPSLHLLHLQNSNELPLSDTRDW